MFIILFLPMFIMWFPHACKNWEATIGSGYRRSGTFPVLCQVWMLLTTVQNLLIFLRTADRGVQWGVPQVEMLPPPSSQYLQPHRCVKTDGHSYWWFPNWNPLKFEFFISSACIIILYYFSLTVFNQLLHTALEMGVFNTKEHIQWTHYRLWDFFFICVNR